MIRAVSQDPDGAWKPGIFRLGPHDRPPLEAACGQRGVAVLDTLHQQLQELAAAQGPSRTPAERVRFAHESVERVGGSTAYGSWVHLPWDRKVVHLLPEEEFFQVITSRNRDKITSEEQRSLRGKRVGVVGLSVGSEAAVALAQEHLCGEIRLADFDELELSNLNRIGSGVGDLGVNKAVLAARRIARINPYMQVFPFQAGVSEENLEAFLAGLDLIVEECDDLALKYRIRERARALGVNLVYAADERGFLSIEPYAHHPELPPFHGRVLHAPPPRGSFPSPLAFMRALTEWVGGWDGVSGRTRASLEGIGGTHCGYPQLASEARFAAGQVGYVSRRLLLGHRLRPSAGYLDLGDLLPSGEDAVDAARPGPTPEPASPGRVALRPQDSARVFRWLRDAFGLEEAHLSAGPASPEDVPAFQARIVLRPSHGPGRPWEDEKADDPRPPRTPLPPGGHHRPFTPGVEVSDLDAAYRRVVALRSPVVRPPMQTSPGGRGFVCRDPDGNRWEVAAGAGAGVSRHWSGVARPSMADAYLAHLTSDTFPSLRTIPGFLRARVLRREIEEGTEFLVVTEWASKEAVRAFAGTDPEVAVVPPKVEAMMVSFDSRVRHYEPGGRAGSLDATVDVPFPEDPPSGPPTPPPAPPEPSAHPALQGFPVVVTTPIRWGDMDAFGHVNNTFFLRYFEVARVAYFDAIRFREGASVGPILASTDCRFRRPLAYPDTVRVGARVTDLGEDRFTHEYVLVSEGQSDVAATGTGLVVSYDYSGGTRVPLPAEVRRRIQELEAM